MSEQVHTWFDLTYASYLVIPRSVLQSLPDELQAQLVAALEGIEAYLEWVPIPGQGTYEVQLRGEDGRYMEDPLADYQRGRRKVTLAELKELAGV